ncbi:hypothetical protein R75483_03900 [Paraburkholderia domus]|nr:hypothetical protein R75483_03900 [Paraburkholderia domus]
MTLISEPMEIASFGHSGSHTSQLCRNVLLLMAWHAIWTLRAAQFATPVQLSRNTQT